MKLESLKSLSGIKTEWLAVLVAELGTLVTILVGSLPEGDRSTAILAMIGLATAYVGGRSHVKATAAKANGNGNGKSKEKKPE